MSKLKVEFIDNSASQYDQNASKIKVKQCKDSNLYLGDRFSATYVQLKARNCKTVVNCDKELHGFSKEPEVNYLNIDPEEGVTCYDSTYKFIDNALTNGKNVVVSCETGNFKGPLIVINYIMRKENRSLAESYKLVQKYRPEMKPIVRLLKSLLMEEKKLRGSNSIVINGYSVTFNEVPKFGSSRDPKKSSSSSGQGFYILFGVLAFFGIVFGVLVMITGKV